MRDRTPSAFRLACRLSAAAVLAGALLPASPCEARRQHQTSSIVRTPPAVDEGAWRTEYYYLDPRPDALFESILAAVSKEQMLPEDRYSTVVMLSMLLAQNPDRTADWAEALQAIPAQNKSTVWHAMAEANTDEAVIALEAVKRADDSLSATVDGILRAPPRDIINAPFDTPNRLTELWAAYFVSGDPVYVKRIIQALEWAAPDEDNEMRALIGGGAYWSLARNCFAHTRVLAICREELKTSDGAIQRGLQAVLNEAESQLANEPCPEPKPAKAEASSEP
jgi:hypothetical protein